MRFLWWGREDPPEVQDYNNWTASEDRRQARALANEINDAQGNLVQLESQHLNAVRELRRLMVAGLPTQAQRGVVDDLARRLRNAQAHVGEMRSYGRFFHKDYFRR